MSGTISGVKIEKNMEDIDITLFQGKTLSFNVVWGGSTPINITGYTARLQARNDYKAPMLLEIIGSIGGANGVITFSKTAAETAAIPAFYGVYDVELTTNGGAVYQVMSGKFKVQAEVTR